MNSSIHGGLVKFLVFLGVIWSFYGACKEFYNIAWGTGNWLGEFSLKWMLVFLLFVSLCILLLIVVGITFWAPQKLDGFFRALSSLRDRLGSIRWIFVFIFLILPVYFLQYSYWGIVIDGPYLRILISLFSVVLVGWFLTGTNNGFLSWKGVLIASILISGLYNFCVPLIDVTSYPFSLGWSEGNRLWDYSILFARHRYDYPSDQTIPVYLDIGRQLAGGIPFLISGITIWQARLWLAFLDVIPYLILGWTAYKLPERNVLPWVLAGIWAFTFVEQGPIHPPLLLCAIVVAFVWKRPLWLAIPLVAASGYFAEISRTTWLFAPALWAGMLELGDGALQNDKLNKKTWQRAISVGLAGVFGGYVAPFYAPRVAQWMRSFSDNTSWDSTSLGGGVTISSIGSSVSSQPLLWYRLFPNATYAPGILFGLLLATAPLVIILIYLVKTGRWKLNVWQKLAIVGSLLAFLVVGLIVSVKIGGGGDLHNLDMFIMGLMFAGAIAWRNGANKWVTSEIMPIWIQLLLIALIVIPAYKPLMRMAPISTSADRKMLATLADITPVDPLPNPLPDTLPSEYDTEEALKNISRAVTRAASKGDVLFMDQRQLLTFGFIKDVPLLPEYDKKVLIDKAMGADAQYFEEFYEDLASHRFSLIITSPLNRRLNDVENQFSEENNAWVKWVAKPLLCYYRPLETYKRVDVQLLVPNQDSSDCATTHP